MGAVIQRAAHVAVTQQFLHGGNIGAALQQVRREAVAQRVGRSVLVYARHAHRLFQRPVQGIGIRMVPQHAAGLRIAHAPLRTHNPVDPAHVDLQDRTVEKQQGAQGLVLGAGSHPARHGEMLHVGPDLMGPQQIRVAIPVKADVPFNPVRIRLLGAVAVVTRADSRADAVEKPGSGHGAPPCAGPSGRNGYGFNSESVIYANKLLIYTVLRNYDANSTECNMAFRLTTIS